jgi:hypothetical protein
MRAGLALGIAIGAAASFAGGTLAATARLSPRVGEGAKARDDLRPLAMQALVPERSPATDRAVVDALVGMYGSGGGRNR